MRLRSLLTCTALAGSAVFSAPDASACGGCFPPPGEQNSVVTDHRMILSIGKNQSTLYDQIRYSGSPSEFAWILPISGEVEVGLSADSLFGGLDTLTSVVVQEPPRNCPLPPESCRNYDESDNAGSSSGGGFPSAGASDGGVSVIKSEVVGPYETVQLHPTSNTDVAALENWLTEHKFNIPADIKPVIAQYVKENFNFLALRLVPDKDVKSMRPVRITTTAANFTLPLRMVAAGTGASVGITLWVLGEGRYEPKNFGSFFVNDDDLTWDWKTSSSNFKTLREQKQAVDPGKLWEVESAVTLQTSQISSAAQFSGGFGGGGDYIEFKDPKTQATITPQEAQQDDFDTLFAGILPEGSSYGTAHVTRLRADLAHASLATDLTVGASADQADLARTRMPKHENGQPDCPVYKECTVTGNVPRDEAIAQSNAATQTAAGSRATTFSCRTTASKYARSDASLSIALGFVGITLGRAIRKRRQQR